MKSLKSLILVLIIGVIIYNFVIDNGKSEYDEGAPLMNQDILAYGDIGAASTWPAIKEGFADVADNITATNYYLVLDGSGSMSGSGCSNGREKIAVAKESLKTFVSKLPREANVGIFAFDRGGIGERLPISRNNTEQINLVLDGIRTGGGTPLSVAIREGNAALTRQAQKQLGYGEYHLVVVTDGEANSGYQPGQAVLELLQGSPIVLHTVGFCIDNRHSLNQPGYTLYKAANDPQSLAAGLEAVLAEAPDFGITDFSGEK